MPGIPQTAHNLPANRCAKFSSLVDTSNPDKIVLTLGADSAEIYYFGATLTSWKVNGQERIFLR